MSGPLLARRGLIYSWDDSFVSWAAKVREDGGSVSSQRAYHVNDLVNRLKSSGLWSKLDRLWLFAGENSQSALRDVKALVQATAVNSPTFTTNRGYTGNSTNMYLNSNFTPSTAGGNYTQNSVMFGAYDLTNNTTAEDKKICGNSNVGNTFFDFILPRFTDNNGYGGAAGSAACSAASSTHQGLWVQTRTSSTRIDLYLNGNAFANSAASTSAGIADQTFIFLARRIGGGINGYISDELSAGFLGGALNAAEVNFFSAALNSYMSALGINVY